MSPGRRLVALLAAAALVGATGCGAGGGGDGGGGQRPAAGATLTVSAAASLTGALTAYAGALPPTVRASFSFAGSDALAAQIEQGVRPDVFAAANTDLPDRLHARGLVERPVVFARNRLVLAVPARGGRTTVASLDDAARAGAALAIGSPSVPIGRYTHTVLARMPAARRAAILANVRSEEPDVAGVVGKLSQGAADAGFVYLSDVRGAGGRLRAIELPRRLQPAVAYAAAVVSGAEHPREARAFVGGLLRPAGRRALAAAGFEPRTR